MLDPVLVLLAIQAAVKLGKKTYAVLVDSTQADPLVLPIRSPARPLPAARRRAGRWRRREPGAGR